MDRLKPGSKRGLGKTRLTIYAAVSGIPYAKGGAADECAFVMELQIDRKG